MTEDSKKTLGNVVQIDEKRIHDHLGELVRGTVEETLNGLLDAEADALCGAQQFWPSISTKALLRRTVARSMLIPPI